MLQKNDLISLVITDITNEASGVGRHEGVAVFVPGYSGRRPADSTDRQGAETLCLRHCRAYFGSFPRPGFRYMSGFQAVRRLFSAAYFLPRRMPNQTKLGDGTFPPHWRNRSYAFAYSAVPLPKRLPQQSTISHPARTGWENSNRFFRTPQPSRHRQIIFVICSLISSVRFLESYKFFWSNTAFPFIMSNPIKDWYGTCFFVGANRPGKLWSVW